MNVEKPYSAPSCHGFSAPAKLGSERAASEKLGVNLALRPWNPGWRARLSFSGLWRTLWPPVTIAVTHIIIDGLKARARDAAGMFLLDQGVHLAIIVACWGLLTDPSALWLYFIRCIQDVRCWIIAVSYIAVIWPAGILVGKITGKWRKKSNHHSSSKTPGLDRDGLLIGRLERFLILIFLLLNRFEAIGFLIAAKSIFRSSELHEHAEYIIIGSMASFSTAIALGMIARYLLGL